jgi:hypothetical protein
MTEKKVTKSERLDRLSSALKANLLKRKQQQRQRKDEDEQPKPTPSKETDR